MSAAHTPGPWTILPNTPHFVRAMHPTDGMQPVATVYHFDGELEANARLIAAAPDLLNLLTAADRLEELTGENLAVYARTFAALARAAIAKAKGGAA